MCRVTFEFAGKRDACDKHAEYALGGRSSWLCVEASYSCNLSCVYCYARGRPTSLDKRMSIQDYQRLFGQAAKIGMRQVSIIGGEPLLNPDISSIAKSASDLGLVVHVCSNGWFIDRDRARALAGAGVTQVQVNFDHMDPGKHDAIRGKRGAFQRALDSTSYMKDAGIAVIAATVAITLNAHVIPDLYSWAKECGFVGFRIWDCIPTRDRNRSRLSLDDLAYHGLMRSMIQRAVGENALVRVDDPALVESKHDPSVQYNGCCAGREVICVSPFGEVSACPMLPALGLNVQKAKLDGAVAAEVSASRDIWLPQACLACSRSGECRGGCRARAGPDGRDMRCGISKVGEDTCSVHCRLQVQ